MSLPKLKIQRLSSTAIIPSKGTPEAAGLDLTATGVKTASPHSRVYTTDLCVEIPKGHCMLIFGRSGLAFKQDIRLGNCVAVIDSDYRGEILVKLTSDESNPFKKVEWPEVGDRIAQFMIVPVLDIEIEEVAEVGVTERGEGGFGSTGR